ncbi:MAG: hypothetical protein HY815_24975 [Candidatus Riflebacteria bacterium]|nr:hypothetical protein [Candidatus Riflebacteria bacterium]
MVLPLGLVSLVAVCPAFGQVSDLELVATHAGGALYRTTGAGPRQLQVVVLRGDWSGMGRQYGALLGASMREFYGLAVDRYLIGLKKCRYEELRQHGRELTQRLPGSLRELIRGMAATSGIGLDRQCIVSALTFLLVTTGCSGLAAWGRYTGGGPLVAGRNWDSTRGPLHGFGRFVTVVVYNPDGARRSVAEVCYVGTAQPQVGMNSDGLFLDLHTAGRSDPGTFEERASVNGALFAALLGCADAKQVGRMLERTLPSKAVVVTAADPTVAEVHEWSTRGARRRGGEGFVASTNHFVHPLWTDLPSIPAGAAGGFTRERLTNLLALGGNLRDSVDVHRLMRILETAIPDGGPSFPPGGPLETYHRVVAVPGQRTL